MSTSKNSITTPSALPVGFILDIIIVTSIILFITGIEPIFFVLLLSFVLAGAVIGTIYDCLKMS
jgi:hypothetical protein